MISPDAAVLADAEALLTCYGAGEDVHAPDTWAHVGAGPSRPPGTGHVHVVVELCYTSSVRYLQPGLLLQVGVHLVYICTCVYISIYMHMCLPPLASSRT